MSRLSTSVVPRRADRQASRLVSGEALVVLIDRRVLYRLNPVGSRVWELCDGRDVAAIVAAITQEFEVDHATAAADVEHFLLELEQAGALTLEASPP